MPPPPCLSAAGEKWQASKIPPSCVYLRALERKFLKMLCKKSGSAFTRLKPFEASCLRILNSTRRLSARPRRLPSPSLWEGRRIRLRIGRGGLKNLGSSVCLVQLVQFVNDRLPSPTCAIMNDGEFDPPKGPRGRVTMLDARTHRTFIPSNLHPIETPSHRNSIPLKLYPLVESSI